MLKEVEETQEDEAAIEKSNALAKRIKKLKKQNNQLMT